MTQRFGSSVYHANPSIAWVVPFWIGKNPYIKEESKRFVEMFGNARRERGDLFTDHGRLPHEILERSPAAKRMYDVFGTRQCSGCRRLLHQDSFGIPFRVWRPEVYCYTCNLIRVKKGEVTTRTKADRKPRHTKQ